MMNSRRSRSPGVIAATVPDDGVGDDCVAEWHAEARRAAEQRAGANERMVAPSGGRREDMIRRGESPRWSCEILTRTSRVENFGGAAKLSSCGENCHPVARTVILSEAKDLLLNNGRRFFASLRMTVWAQMDADATWAAQNAIRDSDPPHHRRLLRLFYRDGLWSEMGYGLLERVYAGALVLRAPPARTPSRTRGQRRR